MDMNLKNHCKERSRTRARSNEKMASAPKSSTRSKVPAAAPDPPTVTLSMSIAEDDDDDDFQNPLEALAIAQNRIISSLRNPSSQPLKASNGTRSRKRPRLDTIAVGKENHRASNIPGKVSHTLCRDKTMAARSRSPSTQINPSGLVENPNSSVQSEPVVPSDSLTRFGEEKVDILAIASTKDTGMVGIEENIMAYKGSYYSMSIESRLSGSRENSILMGEEGDCSEGDDCKDFVPGTQLNVLMNLCCEMDDGGLESNKVSAEEQDVDFRTPKFEQSALVECPLCGKDITNLSEELRQVHSNECLDKDAAPEAPDPIHKVEPNFPAQVVVTDPVLQWLHTLGLSKYEEVFAKEEIDWNTLQWLTEEDLIAIGIDALGPRKKIVNALSCLRQRNFHANKLESIDTGAENNDITKVSVPGNKLITEFFQGSFVDRHKICSNSGIIDKQVTSNRGNNKVGSKKLARKGKFKDIPPWCCIPGTPFRVDAFRYLRGDCSHWFLTHFHIDHYQGLTRNFCHGKIYCSSVTAHLVNTKIGVSWDRLQILPLNQKITIAGIHLTCLDANHCPGSIIVLFEPPNSKAVLHTGDFRFSPEMASSAVLQSCQVHTLILDTTYCNPQYDFPKQDIVIQFVTEAIQAEAFNPKTLFLIGSYTIGKERLYLEIARLLRKKIYVGAAKLRLLTCLGFPQEDMQWFTENEMESHIHVVPMWTLASFKRMKYIANQYSARYDLIVAFSPTGWTFGKGKKKTPGRRWQQGTIIRYEVPYSEHCSFTELREFVRFISPERIIPSVNNDSPESADAMIALLMSDS